MDNNDDKREPLNPNQAEDDFFEKTKLRTTVTIPIPNTQYSMPSGEEKSPVSPFKEDQNYEVNYNIKASRFYFIVSFLIGLSLVFSFVLGQKLKLIFEDMFTKKMIFMFIPYIFFLISATISLLISKEVIVYLNENIYNFEKISLLSYLIFNILSSSYTGYILKNELHWVLMVVLRFFVIFIIGFIARFYSRTDSLKLVSSVVLGFVESYLDNILMFTINFYIYGCILTTANMLFIRVFCKYKILKRKYIVRENFSYLVVVFSCVINSQILYFFSVIAKELS